MILLQLFVLNCVWSFKDDEYQTSYDEPLDEHGVQQEAAPEEEEEEEVGEREQQEEEDEDAAEGSQVQDSEEVRWDTWSIQHCTHSCWLAWI